MPLYEALFVVGLVLIYVCVIFIRHIQYINVFVTLTFILANVQKTRILGQFIFHIFFFFTAYIDHY